MKVAAGIVLCVVAACLAAVASVFGSAVRYAETSRARTFLMMDSLDQDPGQIPAVAAWVNACRKDGPVLVQCQAGLNRSSLVTATALMLGGMTADAAIALLREKRSPACLCNPAFEEWLRAAPGAAAVGLMDPLAALWPGGAKGTAARARNSLVRAGFTTVGDVAACTPRDLLDLRKFGYGQLREVGMAAA